MTAKLVAILAGMFAVVAALIAMTSLHVIPATPTFGAMPGHEIQGNLLTVGGITEDYVSASFTATSSSFCVLQGPNATSTLISFSMMMTNFSAGTWQLPVAYVGTSTVASKGTASSTNPYFLAAVSLATSTPVFWRSGSSTGTSTALVANLWSSAANGVFTSATGPIYPIILPNQFVVAQFATSTPGSFSVYPRGFCNGRFQRAAGTDFQ